MTTQRRVRRRRSGSRRDVDPELMGGDEEELTPDEQVQATIDRIAVPEPPARSRINVGRQPEAPQGRNEAELGEGIDSGSKIDAVSRDHPEYSREHRLRMVSRMLIRNLPLPAIAENLGVSVSTIKRDRAAINSILARQAADIDVNLLVGENLQFFNDIAGQAMRIASLPKTPVPSRLAALRTAAHAKKEAANFLETAGVFDALKFRPGDSGESSTMTKLAEQMEQLLQGTESEDEEVSSFMDEDEEVNLL